MNPPHRTGQAGLRYAAGPSRGAGLCFALMIPAISLPGCEDVAVGPVRERSRLSFQRDEPGTVRLKGIGPIRGFAEGRDNTFMHCLELVLDATGRKIGYDELMGLSGLAFRTQFRVDRWDAGNGDPLVGENCLEALFPAIGWEYEARAVRRDEVAEAAALRWAVQRSIDHRLPVLAMNIIPPQDWGIIVGYRSDRTWLCRAYNGGALRTDRPATGWPSAVVLLTRRHPRPPAKKAHVASIRRAIELFEKGSSGPYALGDKAFDHWRQRLRSAGDLGYVHPNFWTYIELIDARAAAVHYLRNIAEEFGPRSKYVAVAAEWYDREVRLLLKDLKEVPSEKRFGDLLPPFKTRYRQIDVLLRAQALERNAIASLKRAI